MGLHEECGAMKKIVHEFRDRLCAYLMSNGTGGWRQNDIFDKFRHVPKEEIVLELEALWAEEKVQRFTIGKQIVWRATDKINV